MVYIAQVDEAFAELAEGSEDNVDAGAVQSYRLCQVMVRLTVRVTVTVGVTMRVSGSQYSIKSRVCDQSVLTS